MDTNTTNESNVETTKEPRGEAAERRNVTIPAIVDEHTRHVVELAATDMRAAVETTRQRLARVRAIAIAMTGRYAGYERDGVEVGAGGVSPDDVLDILAALGDAEDHLEACVVDEIDLLTRWLDGSRPDYHYARERAANATAQNRAELEAAIAYAGDEIMRATAIVARNLVTEQEHDRHGWLDRVRLLDANLRTAFDAPLAEVQP